MPHALAPPGGARRHAGNRRRARKRDAKRTLPQKLPGAPLPGAPLPLPQPLPLVTTPAGLLPVPAPLLLEAPVRPARRPANARKPLGQILLDAGAIDAEALLRAAALQSREEARLGDILLAHGLVSEADLAEAVALQHGLEAVEIAPGGGDARLVDEIGVETCLRHAILPVGRIGPAVLLATADPEAYAENPPDLPRGWARCRLVVAPARDIQTALLRARRRVLARGAVVRVDAAESCRNWQARPAIRAAAPCLALAASLSLLAPQAAFVALCLLAIACLTANAALRLAAALAQTGWIARQAAPPPPPPPPPPRGTGPRALPCISLLVPLYREREITGSLVRRLGRLTYPRELLDILLIVEEDDALTQAAIAAADLPRHMRMIVVPRGPVRTKPRALNYALDFCRGSIVGVYDAEDAPAPDQLHRVARRFRDCAPDVACLQGVLDFYNAGENWLSRCFAVEYATWFRLVLPGLARLGLVIPLGGTTLFFRRPVLEELGGWDAHNVTEDADLGIRLARHGYRTEMIHTVTEEEANCRTWPWIRQRSRWLKGYAMTWGVHMSRPGALWRDLGARRFIALQVQFLGTLLQFLLAPVLWSFWALPLGLWHPLREVAPHGLLVGLGGLFLAAELLTIGCGVLAVAAAGPSRRWLWPWVPTLHFYFPLATIAAWKGCAELLTRPFFWDKTAHGRHHPPPPLPDVPPPPSGRRAAVAPATRPALEHQPDLPGL